MTRNIPDLDLPDSAKKFLLSKGFESLYPPQDEAVDAGLLEGENLLISAPTASGKTLTATLAMISHLARGGRKILYLSPLRALAAEKHSEFAALSDIPVEEDSAGWGGRTKRIRAVRLAGGAGRTGFVQSVRGIRDADIVVATNESMDSALRRNLEWTDEIDLVIADEIHLIADMTRGPTLEMILTQMKNRSDGVQIVGLSATVQNDSDVADWLGCSLVSSVWRPVPLTEGVCDHDGSVEMNDGRQFTVKSGPEGLPARLAANSVEEGGQSLIFVGTRPSSRATAIRASRCVIPLLSEDDKDTLEVIARKILQVNSSKRKKNNKDADDEHDTDNTAGSKSGKTPKQSRKQQQRQLEQHATDLERDLAGLVRKGVAFHHAGLSERLRSIIEDEFRKGSIKLIASTPTLAAGVNLPARRVVITSVSRYDAASGMSVPISVMEYKQLCGRAGRPQYDKFGESIISITGFSYALFTTYVEGETEPLQSCIIEPKAMRTHLLTVMVLNPGIKKAEILSFFQQTFGGIQSSEYEVSNTVEDGLKLLTRLGMIASKEGRYAATLLGQKTSRLYVDPLTVSYLYRIVRCAPRKGKDDSLDRSPLQNVGKPEPSKNRRPVRHTLGFLNAITCCDEFIPKQRLLKKHEELAHELLSGPHRSEMLTRIRQDECSRSLLVLHEWINERSDKDIETTLKTQAGDLHRMIESAEWLAYVLREMARHAEREDLLSEIAVLQRRIRSGIKEELVELAEIRGVGRVRARALYGAGIRTLDDIRTTPTSKLAGIRQIGPAMAASILRATASMRSTQR